MIDSPKISVALCTYNGEKYLPAQLDSIISQSFPPYEIIIVDDGSSDDTLSVLKQYSMKYQNIHVFCNEERLGFIGNFSLAVSKTHGDYVALADMCQFLDEEQLAAKLYAAGFFVEDNDGISIQLIKKNIIVIYVQIKNLNLNFI